MEWVWTPKQGLIGHGVDLVFDFKEESPPKVSRRVIWLSRTEHEFSKCGLGLLEYSQWADG